MPKMTRTELKRKAQDALMNGIANTLGYYDPRDCGVEMTEAELAEFREIIQREADRVARLFGYESAWSN
ncbi:hypothetical protein DT019_08685 [Streptomyces sp. SDr-06]|uniref:hypothetical protein n=1 Tax=Streptomyces sp. SDr-06 TaxID=2267702 RepID=UPI000DEBBD07|nr:hypothetical protein [Streptomyces sp. SDr-06]RCH68740.1 hypothetical protein DT019_08685 [Streptomyces sp. SDr-06]